MAAYLPSPGKRDLGDILRQLHQPALAGWIRTLSFSGPLRCVMDKHEAQGLQSCSKPSPEIRDQWMVGRGSRTSPIPEGPGLVNSHARFSLGGLWEITNPTFLTPPPTCVHYRKEESISTQKLSPTTNTLRPIAQLRKDLHAHS